MKARLRAVTGALVPVRADLEQELRRARDEHADLAHAVDNYVAVIDHLRRENDELRTRYDALETLVASGFGPDVAAALSAEARRHVRRGGSTSITRGRDAGQGR